MSQQSEYEDGSEPLNIDRIHHWLRIASVVRRHEQENGLCSKLAMVSLCVGCLIVGSTAREITHWALGDTVFGPYSAHVAQVVRNEPYFRCGGGFLPGRSTPEEPHRQERTVVDEADPLPEPAG